LGKALPLSLPCSRSLSDTFVILGQKLATIYLAKTYNGMATDIRFEIAKVEEFRIPSHKLRIALVNMVDQEEDAVRYFFQGSACSQTSLYRLTATFLQPQLNPPLLDGLVLIYNGNLLSELDHINLAGILTPRLPLQVTERAIHRAKRKALVNHNNRREFPVPTS